jgi:transposase
MEYQIYMTQKQKDYLIQSIKAMRKHGNSQRTIARRLGISTAFVRKTVDPASYYATLARSTRGDYGPNKPTPEETAARLAERPKDTRTPQERLLGEPIYERSALYRRQHGG